MNNPRTPRTLIKFNENLQSKEKETPRMPILWDSTLRGIRQDALWDRGKLKRPSKLPSCKSHASNKDPLCSTSTLDAIIQKSKSYIFHHSKINIQYSVWKIWILFNSLHAFVTFWYLLCFHDRHPPLCEALRAVLPSSYEEPLAAKCSMF